MCASLLFNDEEYIPEQVIAEQTGHHGGQLENISI